MIDMCINEVKLCIHDLDLSEIDNINLDMRFKNQKFIKYELNFNKRKFLLGFDIIDKLIELLKKINGSQTHRVHIKGIDLSVVDFYDENYQQIHLTKGYQVLNGQIVCSDKYSVEFFTSGLED